MLFLEKLRDANGRITRVCSR